MKAKKPKNNQIYFICTKCAEKAGGVWPEGHVATSHIARCPVCGKIAMLASTGDWHYPNGMPADFIGGRD